MVLDKHLGNFVSEHLAYFCPSCFLLTKFFCKDIYVPRHGSLLLQLNV